MRAQANGDGVREAYQTPKLTKQTNITQLAKKQPMLSPAGRETGIDPGTFPYTGGEVDLFVPFAALGVVAGIAGRRAPRVARYLTRRLRERFGRGPVDPD